MARRIPGKADFGETIRYFTKELSRLGVVVNLNTQIDDARGLHDFDGVVLATGVLPKEIAIRGRDLSHVIDYAQLLAHDAPSGERVAILGAGGIAVDIAHFLTHGEADADLTTRFLYEQGLAASDDGAVLVTKRKTVAMMRRGRSIGERIGKTTRWAVLAALRAAGVTTLTGVAYEAIEPGGIRVRTAAGEERLIEADTIVIAAGQERNDARLRGRLARGVRFELRVAP
jgi:2,4-dienoyl-CoA reductase (NADPH2)